SHHLFYSYSVHFDLLSFPTRRSSDLRFFIFHRGGEPSANLENPGRERHGRRVSPAPATMTCGAVAREISPKRECPAKSPSKSPRSEEHTSELQSRFDLVCRLLLEKKK